MKLWDSRPEWVIQKLIFPSPYHALSRCLLQKIADACHVTLNRRQYYTKKVIKLSRTL